MRRELQEQGYSEREISEFANRDDLATSAMADDVGPYGRCAIFPEKVLPNAHRMEDMVLIDIFPLLRSIRYLAQSSDYLHARKFLRILIQHEKAYRQISDPGRKARSAGKKSGRVRKKTGLQKKKAVLARALRPVRELSRRRSSSFLATMTHIEVRQYQTTDGRKPLSEWLDGLRDAQARARIIARLDRLSVG